jgi:hypothetical protein
VGLRGYCSSALVSFLRTYPLCICCEFCKVSDRTFLSRCKLWCNQWKGTCPNYFFILALVMSSTNGDRASLSRSIPVSFRIHIVMCTRVFICTIFCNPEKIEVGQPLLKMWIITMIHRFSCFFPSLSTSLSLLFNYYVCVYIYTHIINIHIIHLYLCIHGNVGFHPSPIILASPRQLGSFEAKSSSLATQLQELQQSLATKAASAVLGLLGLLGPWEPGDGVLKCRTYPLVN